MVKAPFISTLRDVNIRMIERVGMVTEMWCVLPEDKHEQAVDEMVRLGHMIEALNHGYLYEGVKAEIDGWKEGHTVRGTGSGMVTEWRVSVDGRMLTVTEHEEEWD